MNIDRREFLASFPAALVGTGEMFSENLGGDKLPIIDVSAYGKFRRIRRKKTNFLIVHCTDIDYYFEFLNTFFALHTLLSHDRNAHYLIRRNGSIYKLVPDELVADHAGFSMWNGRINLNRFSIGVELEGTDKKPFTDDQYKAFRYLYRGAPDSMTNKYGIDDSSVLYHSQVAYCPSRQVHEHLGLGGRHAKAHRGRKSDPGKFFDREKAGIRVPIPADPDVRRGMLLPY